MANRIGSQNWPIQALPGLSPQGQRQLQQLGITTTFALLKAGAQPQQRIALARRLVIHARYVNKWVALADLARVPGVGCQYSGLLLHAGISSPQQLAHSSPQRLHPQLRRLQTQLFNRRDQCPNPAMIADWVQQARQILPLAQINRASKAPPVQPLPQTQP